MKSRTSFFNPTAFRKNLTRFAPAWSLYGVLMLLILITMVNGSGRLDEDLMDMMNIFSIANVLFAFLTAQLLWGDLYNFRMCNALHALPMRREGWFLTNLASGMSFSLIPTLAALVFCLLVIGFGSRLDNGLIVPLMVFLGANLQYLFFFGLASLSAFLVGSRFAMAVIYGMLNFGALIIYWLVDTLYTPLLYGLKTVFAPFILFSPVVQMCDLAYMDIEWIETSHPSAYYNRGVVHLGDGWGYLGVCAVIGIAMMGLALVLYRKRKLECAGDFMAVKGMEPVFLVIYTLFAGALFQLFFGLFNGNDIDVFLFVGLIVGFFTGRMLIKRTVRVFQWKAWGACAVMIAAFSLSLIVTLLDPLNIQRWVPKAEEVQSVSVYANHGGYASSGEGFAVSDPADIEKLIAVHTLALSDRENLNSGNAAVEQIVVDGVYTTPIQLAYHMKNGTTVHRYYYIWTNREAGQILKDYFASIECVLGITEAEIPVYAATIREVYVEGEVRTLDKVGLLRAMAADCAEGNMVQVWAYRRTEGEETSFYVEFSTDTRWTHVRVNNSCRHTIAWLEENGIDVPDYDEKFG